jgi:hypothetical protein
MWYTIFIGVEGDITPELREEPDEETDQLEPDGQARYSRNEKQPRWYHEKLVLV